MSAYKITIPFTPKPKGSVRLGKKGAYNPSAYGMKRLRNYVAQRLNDEQFPLLKGPLLVIIHFRLPGLKSHDLEKRKARHLMPHTSRPDGDNLEKFVNDALNGVLWADDCTIVWMVRSKTWTAEKEGETSIYACEIDDDVPNDEFILEHIRDNIEIEWRPKECA
jgi:Holliday junction resolvase RusA-like endonuclease